MSFRLTYSSTYDPPEELHERFERALASYYYLPLYLREPSRTVVE